MKAILTSTYRISLILAIAMGLPYAHLQAKHTLTDAEVTVVNGVLTECLYSFTDKNISIPDTLENQAIKGISNAVWPHVFSNKGLKTVQLPSTLERIGDKVFEDNNNLTIIIPKSVSSIGNNAFSDIDSFIIEEHSELRTIGSYAFKNHTLNSITLPDGIISVGNNAFKCDNSQFYFELPQPTDPNFTHWEDQDGTTIPSNTKITDTKSSYYTNLEYELKDEDVIIENNTLVACSYDFSCKHIIIPSTLDGQEIKRINTVDFKKRDIVSVSLPSKLAYINQYAFYYNIISSLNIPNSIITIGEGAFYSNPIKSLTFDAGSQLKAIEISAFENHRLSSISLPQSLVSIGNKAFYSYYAQSFFYDLPNASATDTISWFDSEGNTFNAGEQVTNHNTTYYTNLRYTLVGGDVSINADGIITACSYDHSSKTIIIPPTLQGKTVKGIDDGNPNTGVFANKNIYEVFLPNTLETIGEYEFLDLSNNYFKRLEIPASVKRIKAGAFTSRADTLEFNDIENSELKIIDNFAFDNHSLDEVTLPNSVIAIGAYAFRCNNSQFSFRLPYPKEAKFTTWYDSNGRALKAGTRVTDLSLSYCTNLEYTLKKDDVTIQNGVITACSYDFARKFIIIPDVIDGQKIIGIDDGIADRGVFQDKNLMSLQLPSGLKRIGDYEFRGNYPGANINHITIPRSVDSIGIEAFYGCGLNNLTLEDSSELIYIGTAAFDENDIGSFKLPSSNLTDIGTWGDGAENYYEKEAIVRIMSTSYAMRWIPVAQFEATPRNVKENHVVQFTDISLNTPTEWLWRFGDGASSKEQNPTHIYEEPGKYTVTLIVSKAAGRDTLRESKYMTVVPDKLEFETHPQDTICAPGWDVFFSATSNTVGATFRWESKMPDGQWTPLTESETYQQVDSSILLVNNVKLAQNQEQFRVIIERENEQMISDTATMTVRPSSWMKVYPNPTQDILNVELIDVKHTLQISNAMGQRVYTSPIEQQSFVIHLGSWPEKGVYFIHLLNDKGETLSVEKLLLQY